MKVENYKEVEKIFVEVVDLPPNQRRTKIDQLTTDLQLIESVEQLLNEHDSLLNNPFMDTALLDIPLGKEDTTPNDPPPTTIQGYTILRVLGRGSSGTVYLAKASFPLERLVALKIIHHGSGKNTLARFREEQRILAKLKHPGIAEVYDEGLSENGRPFTVLEYIDAEPITDYCRSHDLDWRGIIILMIQCCDAIAHAHQHNIIHRDLKPSNIIVTETDGSPRIKVIDFGTAKLIDPLLFESPITIDHEFVGTLPYSSPEQLSGNDTPDTRTDVHGLAVVLYECLEKKNPFYENGVGLKAAIDLVMNKAIPSIKQKSGLPDRELNAILSQACAKDPDDRYASPVHFSEDLQNLIAGLPVHAMKARPVYIALKFIRRHRMLLGTAGIVVALLAFTAGIAITQSILANKRRNALRETAIRMVDDLMPMLSDLSGSAQARQELTASLHQRVDELLLTDPSDRDLLLHKARILEYESDIAQANRLLDKSENLRRQAADIIDLLIQSGSENNEELSSTQRRLSIKLGDVAKDRNDFSAAQKDYEQAHKSLLAAPGDHRLALCWSLERLSSIAKKQGKTQESFDLAHQRMELSRQLLNEYPDSAESIRNCATACLLMTEQYISKELYEPALQHAQSSKNLADELILIEPDNYLSQEMKLLAATSLTRSLLYNNRTQESVDQSKQAIRLATELVEHNPGRQVVRNIAWSKLWVIHYLFQTKLPQHDLAELEKAMHTVFPNKITG